MRDCLVGMMSGIFSQSVAPAVNPALNSQEDFSE
jgi:hypothetical protein